MRHLAALPGPLAAVVVTGDIADHGLVGEYEIARELLDSGLPTIVCPGNHDDRQAFRKAFLREEETGQGARSGSGDGYGDGYGPVNQVLRLDGLTVVLCDSSIPGRPEGYLQDETIAWLDAVLAESPGVPTLVGMHHPATVLGVPYVDEIRLREPERLEEVLRRHPQVVAVLAGHAHTPASTRFADRPLLVAPGVVSTLLLPAESTLPIPLDLDLPPQISLHVLDGDRLTTHIRMVV
nr:metallophosphoesterase [Planobispora longispora]